MHMYSIFFKSFTSGLFTFHFYKEKEIAILPIKKQDASCFTDHANFVWFYSSVQCEKFSNRQSRSETVTSLGHFPFLQL